MNGAVWFVASMVQLLVVLALLVWLVIRKWREPLPPPATVYLDLAIAAVRDPAARAVLDQLQGQVRTCRAELAYATAALDDVLRRLQWVQYREGNPFDQDRAKGEILRAGYPEAGSLSGEAEDRDRRD